MGALTFGMARSRSVIASYKVVDILTFELDGQRYAFPSDQVVRVVQMVAVTPLPGAPAVVEGVVDVHGTIVPVFDLRARAGLPPRAVDPSQHLVVLRGTDRNVAVRVDDVSDFVEVPDANITEMAGLAGTGVGTGVRHISGVASTVDGTVVIHDLLNFLSLSESAALESALTSGDR